MAGIAKFGAISLDSKDPHELGQFYQALLGFEIRYETEDVVVMRGDGVMLTVERVADHVPPDWPENKVPKQMHMELFVAELDSGEEAAVALGAVKPEFQPAPDRWRVLLDPSGHPFCLTVPPSV
ncbi:VOC family protein [Nocardia sp. NPDC056000]|uniref:VOC family protein n=1 Tax=Nocardia sp. NPDC056000 TaxID=3345674 RepID=UPI0035D5EC1C